LKEGKNGNNPVDKDRIEKHRRFKEDLPVKAHLHEPGTESKTGENLAENHFWQGIGGEIKAEKKRDKNEQQQEKPANRPVKSRSFRNRECIHVAPNHQAPKSPNINNQIIINIQMPITKQIRTIPARSYPPKPPVFRMEEVLLIIGYWNLFGAWNLVIVYYVFSRHAG
jgi:hypothetical protein